MELKEVFEPIVNFMKSFQKKEKDISKQAAKDRLKLVLMQDRASVSPDFFEMMKKEIIDVIKKYIEIDEESLEVELTRGFEAGLEGPALYANIPIKNVKPVASKVNEAEDNKLEEIANTIADEILSEAEAKVESSIASEKQVSDEKGETVVEDLSNENEVEVESSIDVVKAEEEVPQEVKQEEEMKVENIAKNVANEMKKSLKASAAGSKNIAKANAKRTAKAKASKK